MFLYLLILQKKIFSERIIALNFSNENGSPQIDFSSNISDKMSTRCVLPINFDNSKIKSVLTNRFYKETKKIVEKNIAEHFLHPLKLKENEYDADKDEKKIVYLPYITISDFDLFLNMLRKYYFPSDNLSLETFFKFVNILSCLNLEIDENLSKILTCLLLSVQYSSKYEVYDYKQTILQYIEIYYISFDILTILTDVFLDLSIYKIDILPILFLDTNDEEIYHFYNIKFETKNSISISDNISKIFSDQNLRSKYFLKIIFIIFIKKKFKTAVFHIIPSKNTDLRLFLLMILNSVDRVIFYQLIIDLRLILLLNETGILKNLKTIHFCLNKTNSNILAYIEYILDIANIFIEFKDYFEQNKYEKTNMKPQSIIKIFKYKLKNYSLKNPNCLEVKNYVLNSVFLIESISDFEMHFGILNKICELHYVHIILYENTSSIIFDNIEIYIKSFSICLSLNITDKRYLFQTIPFKNIKNLKIKNMDLESAFIDIILKLPGLEILYLNDCDIANCNESHIYPKNYSITTFCFLGKKLNNVNMFHKFIVSMVKLKSLEIDNDYLSLSLESDQKCIFSSRIQLNVLGLSCIFQNSSNDILFYFPFSVSEEISFGLRYPAGTLKKIFSIPENNKIKKLSYYENYLDVSDIGALENLKFLENIELTSNVSKIRFHKLFDTNKIYNLKFIELKKMDLNQQDIVFFCSLNDLKILNLINCGFKKNCYLNLKGNHLKSLNSLYFEYFSSSQNRKIKMHLKEEFSLSILVLSSQN